MIERSDAPPVLTLADVHKVYPSGTHAVRGVSLAVRPGSVHGLIGANGAGKSTLIKIVSGVETLTSGTVTWKGQPVRWTSPHQALSAGLGAVHQHTPLVPTMTVLDNVFLGLNRSLRWDPVGRKRELDELCDRIGYHLRPDALVSELSVGARQMVAILQVLARDPALVLLDEPTAALSPTEREVLFGSIRRLRDQGTTFIYVSHFLDEVLALTDQLTVLRDGQVVVDAESATVSMTDLVAAIVGEKLATVEHQATHLPQLDAEPLLVVDRLRSPGRFGPISFTVNPGEIVGIAGLLGSGRTELLEAIFGADPAASGQVRVDGQAVRRSPRSAVRAGLALVPEDRNRKGLLREWEIWRNMSLPYLGSLSWRGIVPDVRRERALAERATHDLRIRSRSADHPVGELSGGNAQKVVFAKWLYGPAKVFLLDEPSAGVDVGTKADIINLIRRLADQGKAVVIVASEFEELLAASHRVLVVRRGQLVTERAADTADLHELTALASGL
jgi:ribose transport system ATP-binding protein